jgi:alpha-L-rhamnosidase
MKYKKIILFFLVFSMYSVLGMSRGFKVHQPYGLMTDLIEHTELTWQNGYEVKVPADKLKGPFQYAEIRSSRPRFSWIVNGKKANTYQLAYRIIVTDNYNDIVANKGSMWNSGWVHSRQSVAIAYHGKSLQPNKTYFWKVKDITNTDGESAWSDIKVFRTASSLSESAVSCYPLAKSKEHPISLVSSDPNVLLADFGKDAFGQISLRINSVVDGDTANIHLGECLAQGRVNRHPGGTIRYEEYRIPLRKGTHVYSIKIVKDPRNTSGSAIRMPDYIGEVLPFRYCEIECKNINLKKEDITRESVHYPFNDEASFFKCDNDTLNGVFDLCKYSIKATSFAGIYVDGDRERTPYAADTYINQLGHYGVDREYSMARRTYSYVLNHPTWPTEWVLQTALIAWNDYLYTGDNRMLLSTYEQLKPYLLTVLQEKNGLISTITGLQTPEFLASIKSKGKIRDIVDWPSTGKGLKEGRGGETDGFVFTDYNAVVNAYYYEVLKVMSSIARAIGKDNESEQYFRQSESFKSLFNHLFWNKEKNCYQDGLSASHTSLHSNIFPLAFGMVPADRQRSVVHFIESRGMACSVYGAQFLLDALYNASDANYALHLLSKTDDRSWFNMLRAGSTITMEAWDNKYKPNQDWNHAWGSAPANVIPMELLGIKPLKPGFSMVCIKPQIGKLKWVDALVPTIRGGIRIYIENKKERYRLRLILPANMRAKVYLPFSSREYSITDNGKYMRPIPDHDHESYMYLGTVGSGFHQFEVFPK